MSERDPLLDDVEANREVANAAADVDEKPLTWREWLGELLESKLWHRIVITLITIDAACVLADLTYTFLSDQCPPEDESPLWLEVLAHISLAITTLFLVEIPLSLWSHGPKFYKPLGPVPHASLHLFDAVVILGTFVLEVFLKGREQELAGLLIILRLWRLVKLVGGVAVGAGEIDEELSNKLVETQHELNEKSLALIDAREEISRLKSMINNLQAQASSILTPTTDSPKQITLGDGSNE